MIMSLLPKDVKTDFTINDISFKSNLSTIKTFRFTKKYFFYVILRFTQSHSGPLEDLDCYIQINPGTYKNDTHINLTSIDKVHLKFDCIQGSIFNGIREPILYSFALDQPPPHRKFKPRIKLFKKINKTVVSHFNFYFEDDDHKSVDFN